MLTHSGSRPAPSLRSAARHPVLAPPWRWAVLGAALGFVCALVFFAPAWWLASALARASAGQVQLVEPRGTVWTGSARLLLSGGQGSRDSAVLPGQIDWRIRPDWRGLRLAVQAECCTGPSPLRLQVFPRWAGARMQLADGLSRWPAEVLAGLGTPWNTVQAEGVLQLETQGLSVEWFEGRLAVAGRAELSVLGVSSRLSNLKPMGSYRLTLAGGATPTLELTTLEGSLQLSGTGSWVGARLRFQGVASAAPEDEASLANLLNIIGRRSGARSIISLG